MLTRFAPTRSLAALFVLTGGLAAPSAGAAPAPATQEESPKKAEDRAEDRAEAKFTLDEFELNVDLSGLEELSGSVRRSGQQRGRWTGKYNGVDVSLDLGALTVKDGFEFSSPSEISMIVGNNRGNAVRKKGGSYSFEISKPLEGKFGYVPYGWLAAHDTNTGTKIDGYDILLGGVTKAGAYFLDIRIKTRFSDKEWVEFEKWACSVFDYTGEVVDPNWTEEETDARWKRSMPASVEGNNNNHIHRTKYYIIFTNVGKSSVRGFGKKADENYEEIQSIFPFDDLPGQKLLPIFYFVNKSEYIDWCVQNISWSAKQAERSAGVASGDKYSTYHQSAVSPTHIHEQTHQIFGNRLHLGGGGSWFQEGVAEYMGTQPSELNEIKQRAKDGKTQPFEELFTVPSLLMSSSGGTRKEGGSVAGGAYTQAGSVIEFAKHSKFGQDKFIEWVHAMGSVGRGDLPAIKRGISAVYDVTLEEFEAEYIAYWSKRKKVKGWHSAAKVPKKKKKKKKR